ncbi:MAG: topoisomerase protein [Microgenomates group bacterium GW2011_GWA1_48_10]|uniref:DNA topoisomerase 1 n=1 Tax=Candidatus Gottesmanbacteria bacterium RIFCSPHIGHO2_01_FULL_47_48 TaxID=1798381 RepID=A0A1F6A566_9BACT|nr:MAG: topoisomerase protein [Microgenomates group bacterium GW2011_GWA1_48_10]OGG19602.1 MAG: DNA topoisomerase I [Candidatus Gottesmanbacteria bacterium RIFCSPHIGHO2_01_FULL_47_48]
MNLIIVESPTKAKTLARFLGDEYRIEASMGHVRDLPESKLGIDVEHGFEPTYVVAEKKQARVKELQSLAAKADTIILATDPDREGEAIAYHLAQLISENSKFEIRNSKHGKDQRPIQRITFHEITEGAIKEALSHPGIINMQLVDAQQARRVLDRLVGYKLSPLLWRKVRKGLSAGRVQSVAVRLIVEREREIRAFVPVEYWEILARLRQKMSNEQSSMGNTEFEAKLVKIDERNAEIGNQEEADKIVTELEKAEYRVSDVQKKEVKRSPYPPFTTSTLQQAASNLMGWSAKRTMQVAQSLYEQGLITYHRTDSMNLSSEAVAAVRQFIGGQYGSNYLPEGPRFYKTKSKVAQEAHEAIRPTRVETNPVSSDSVRLDRDQLRLYDLIWKRFVACQMSSAEYEQTSVDIQGSRDPDVQTKYLLRANGSKQIFDGWQNLYQKGEGRREKGEVENGEGENKELPELTLGEILELLKLLPSQHFTEPPPRYTEASLIKVLEEYGIGRPSTYAPIISTIQERQYVEKTDKKLIPTNLGFAVNDFLITNFPSVFDYQFTAKMEDELDEIAAGEKEWVPVLHEFYDPFSELLTQVQDNAVRVKVEVEETDEICPLDGGKLVVRVGRFGKFLACSNFPNCKFTKPFQKKLDIKCPKCGVGEVILKRTKSRKSFYGCSRYPECDFASWTKPKEEPKAAQV